jgi:hypothetical protein
VLLLEACAASRPRPSAVHPLLDRVRSEFLEMPGLQLTTAQARRFWTMNEDTCNMVLSALLEQRFLVRTTAGMFRRPG